MSDARPVGYGKPPSATRFTKGQSGNPKGRPRGRSREIPNDGVLGQMVTIREDGRTRRVTAAEAFLMQLTQKGLAGDSAATRASLEAIESARASHPLEGGQITQINLASVESGMDAVLAALGIAVKKYPEDEKRVRWEINPWIVQLALARLEDRRLTIEEQQEVWNATRTPHKVRWPEWWEIRG